MWPDCSPPRIEPIFVPDISPEHANASLTQRDFQSHVGHGSGNDRRPAQHAAYLHVPRDQQKHAIAIDHATVGIAEQRAIRVPIKGNAQIKFTLLLGDCAGQRLGMQCSTVFVDVLPVRTGIDECCLDSARPK
jgi:hypothetical protein